MRSEDAGTDRRSRAGGGPWVAAGANLALGVCAILPGTFIHWLVTHYLPMDCTNGTTTGGPGCDRDTYALASFYKEAAAASGLVVLALTVVVDVLMPRQERWSMRVWLGMTVLIPVPFFAGLALGRF
ncbi:hypothetical protein [Streptomyces sp. NPDC048332]|uniref:hypothetical protein n=1 Tax=Streptomyces sp. NPDC048332 TaxID=3154619 RepID=UPI00343A6198